MSNTTTSTTRRREYTPEQKARRAAWQREYRRKYPERVRGYYRTYILNKAAQLLSEDAARGSAQHAGRD